MTGDDIPDQRDMETMDLPAARRQGAGFGLRLAGRILGAVARIGAGGNNAPTALAANGGPVARLIAVEDILMLAAGDRQGSILMAENLVLPIDPALDRLAGFLKAARVKVERRALPFNSVTGVITLPLALPGTGAARQFPQITVRAVINAVLASGAGIQPLGVTAKQVWRLDPGTGVETNVPLSSVSIAHGPIVPATTPQAEIIAGLELAADSAGAQPSPAPEPNPFAIGPYRLAMTALTLVSEPYLAWRARRGKEDPDRKEERFGRAGLPRPPGRLGWVHAASVGESVSALPLIQRLLDFDDIDHLLVTTGTITSAEIMDRRLPAQAIHQYIPLDSPSFVAGFIGHWQPDFAVFVESEIWPNLYEALQTRQIPLAIVNGRMSARSFAGWQRHPRFIGPVLASTEICIAQNATYARHYAQLGAANVVALGNVKFDGPPLPASPGELKRLGDLIGARPVWLAASTHPGEEEMIAEIHVSLRDKYPDLLTILVPRHPERGEQVATLLEDLWLATARRSAGSEPSAKIDVYVADTIGELGLFFRLCPFAFIGGSLVEIGGHNPTEAANLDCAILHGKHVQNFRDMFETFDEAGAAIRVADASQLLARVEELIVNPSQVKTMTAAGRKVLRLNAGALDRTVAALTPIITRHRDGDD